MALIPTEPPLLAYAFTLQDLYFHGKFVMRADAVGTKRWAWKDEQGLIKSSTSVFENYSQEKIKRIAEEFPTIPEEHIQTVWAQ